MIPASLIVVLTITMAVSTKIMVSQNVIVRKLNSLEALGAVTNICSDKTGTLTQGKMIVQRAWVAPLGTFSVGKTNTPLDPTSALISLEKGDSPHKLATSVPKMKVQKEKESPWVEAREFLQDQPGHLQHYLNIATCCNTATVALRKPNSDAEKQKDKEKDEPSPGGWDARGDPTEIAIQVFTSRFDWNRRRFTHAEPAPRWSLLAEYPFDSDVKRMSVVYRCLGSDSDTPASRKETHGQEWAFMKGAVERVLEACTHIQLADGRVLLDSAMEQTVLQNMEALAGLGVQDSELRPGALTGLFCLR